MAQKYKIDKHKLIKWLEPRLGECKEKGRHILTNEPRGRLDGTPDKKFNMVWWPEGRAFKSWIRQEWHGTIVKFVMEWDGCSFADALEKVACDIGAATEAEFQSAIDDVRNPNRMAQERANLALANMSSFPPGFVLFTGNEQPGTIGHQLRQRIVDERRIIPELFGLGYVEPHQRTQREIDEHWPSMDYRVVIPYYAPNGGLLYWTARDMHPDPDPRSPRYFNMPLMGVEKERQAANAGFVDPDTAFLWVWSWSQYQKEAFIVEGAFDAMTLCHCGFFGIAASNAVLLETQAAMIRKYLRVSTLTIAIDNDSAAAVVEVKNAKLLQRRGWRVKLVSPPPEFKDWNACWQSWHDKQAIQAWINTHSRPLTLALEVEKKLANLKFNF